MPENDEHPLANRGGVGEEGCCPRCQNSLQNGTPADRPDLRRCATCKTVFRPLAYGLSDEALAGIVGVSRYAGESLASRLAREVLRLRKEVAELEADAEPSPDPGPMPPKETYTVTGRVTSVERREPRNLHDDQPDH